MPTRRTTITAALTALGLAATALLVSAAPSQGDSGGPPPVQAPPAVTALALAPAQTSTSFVPVTPCRIVDTRHGGGPLAKSSTRTFAVSGTTGFTGQGGKATGCGVPASATAVAASFTAVKPTKKGSLRAYAGGAANPGTATVSYVKKQSATAGATIAIRPANNQALTVANKGGPANLLVDVTGYYVPPMHGMVAPGGSIYAGSSRIVSATNSSPGIYQVTFDSPITYCTPLVDTYNAGAGIYGAAYAFSGNTATVFTWYLDATTHAEKLYNFYFYIAIVC